MSKVNKIFLCLCCTLIFALSITVTSTFAADTERLVGGEFAKLAWGGVLYDNWPKEFGVKIAKTHPSYPAEGTINGVDTWRCKECHGWDYKGQAGDYSKGRHYTGIKGIRDYAYHAPEKIIKILKDDTHLFKTMIPENALEALALFVSYGQIDMDPYVDRNTKKAVGKPKDGARIYLTTCIKCHGEDGREINFKDAKNPVYIGTIANNNPWETLHKIRWGHPGTQMISLLFLGLKEQLDVLSFCQTLADK